MMKKMIKTKNLYLIEPSFVFGGTQVRLPYSTGLIWSYCRTNDIINKNYNCEFFSKKSCSCFNLSRDGAC